MTARSLDSFPQTKSVRSPSYEMQTMAISQGYASVRDWAIDQLIDEVWALRARVAELESGGEVVAEG